MNPSRYALADITTPWYQTCGYFLIPKPQPQANYKSLMKPFQWPVRKTTNLTMNLWSNLTKNEHTYSRFFCTILIFGGEIGNTILYS